jgi:hypothetical protein
MHPHAGHHRISERRGHGIREQIAHRRRQGHIRKDGFQLSVVCFQYDFFFSWISDFRLLIPDSPLY